MIRSQALSCRQARRLSLVEQPVPAKQKAAELARRGENGSSSSLPWGVGLCYASHMFFTAKNRRPDAGACDEALGGVFLLFQARRFGSTTASDDY
jgi:hypothetical protein